MYTVFNKHIPPILFQNIREAYRVTVIGALYDPCAWLIVQNSYGDAIDDCVTACIQTTGRVKLDESNWMSVKPIESHIR